MSTVPAHDSPAKAVRIAGLRAVLFDFGGTLDGDGVHWSTRFHEAYARAGLEVARERFDAAFVEADRRIAAHVRPADTGWRELLSEQVARQMEVLGLHDPALERAVVADTHAAARATLARSAELLGSLRPQLRLGIISNFTGALANVCREEGLLPLLDVIVDSAVEGVAKPDPEIFHIALRRLGLPPGDCLMVGDSFDRDVVPAKQLGLRAVWLRGPSPRPCPDPDLPDAVVNSLRDLPGVLGIRV
jgi:putative hydrolase of the HAD superfamily